MVRVAALKQQLPRRPEIKALSESCGFMLPVTSAESGLGLYLHQGQEKTPFVCGRSLGSGQSVSPSVRPMWILAFGWVWNQKKKKGRKRMEVEAAPQKKAKHGFGWREE